MSPSPPQKPLASAPAVWYHIPMDTHATPIPTARKPRPAMDFPDSIPARLPPAPLPRTELQRLVAAAEATASVAATQAAAVEQIRWWVRFLGISLVLTVALGLLLAFGDASGIGTEGVLVLAVLVFLGWVLFSLVSAFRRWLKRHHTER